MSADEALEQTSLRQTWGCWLDGGLADERSLADEGVGAFNRVLGGGTNMGKKLDFSSSLLGGLSPIFNANHGCDFKHIFTVENLLGDWSLQATECYILETYFPKL